MDVKADMGNEDRIFESSLFREYMRNRLIALLDSISGKKLLIIESQVLNPINQTIERKALNEHGIQDQDIKFLEYEYVEGDHQRVIFFVTPQVKNMKRVESIIRETEKRNQKKKEQTLVFWPQRTTLCKEALEQADLLQTIDIRDFNFDLIPLDSDLLSLEMETSFRDLYLDNDLSAYGQVAESIMRMQLVYGKIPNIFLKGDGAKIVQDIMENIRNEEGKSGDDTATGDIETLIILDRSIDFITPLLTQMTQCGRIDEVFGIKGNIATFGPKVVSDKDETTRLAMSCEKDSVFSEVRDMHLLYVGRVYDNKQIALKQIQNEKSEKNNKLSIEETQRLYKRVQEVTKDVQSSANHLNIKAYIVQQMKSIQFFKELQLEQGIILGQDAKQCLNYLEYIIPLGRPLHQILRLMCLQSLIDKGIKEQSYNQYMREIIHAQGFDVLCTLNNLSKVGLLKKQDGTKSDWRFLKDDLKLLNENVNQERPDDLAYTYSGYAPITARLVEHALAKGTWKNIKEIDRIPGYKAHEVRGSMSDHNKKRAVLVYIVGGVTYSEISAFRYVANYLDKEIIIATTHMINSKKIIESVYDHHTQQG